MVSVRWALLILCVRVAYGGQSIVLSNAVVENTSVPAQGANGSCRVEWSFHDWAPNVTPISHPVYPEACGMNVYFQNLGPNDLRLQFEQRHSRGPDSGVCQVQLGTLQQKFATVRYQHVPNGAGGVDTCEAWDIKGVRYFSDSKVYTSTEGTPSKGVSITGTQQDFSTAYFRLFTSTVPMGSRPPVTADRGDLLEWKFDGNREDASGHGYSGSSAAGSQRFVPTPGQDLVVAVIKTANAPVWSDWTSLRVGYPNELDCGNSYSQADESSQVSCNWTSTGGPTAPTWSGQDSQRPVLTDLAFGSYALHLTVTDATRSVATADLAVGAVAYDDSGIVIPSDPRVTEIFGPMIAFGQNPWGYEEERAKAMVGLQNASFKRLGINPPGWTTPAQGTVSYLYSGIGLYPSLPGSQLSSDVTSSSSSFPVADAGRLPGLTSLPSWFVLGPWDGSQELVRICSATAINGPAVLTACYDGRGLTNSYGTSLVRSWPEGTSIGEYRVSGTNTRFVSDTQRPICPAGAPGPPGPVLYSDGSVSLGVNSTHILGNNVVWDSRQVVTPGTYIRIEATHDGGVPFVYWSRIDSVPSSNEIVVSRPLPADVDAGPFPYKIVGYRYVALGAKTPYGDIQYGLEYTQGCESETALFVAPSSDLEGFNQVQMSGMPFSYKDSLGIQSVYGPNFYGSGLAARAFYFQSGWDVAKETADIIDDYWARDPELAGGWRGGSPYLRGGAVVGAIASLVTNPATKLSWNDVRPFVGGAEWALGHYGCNEADTRDSGYMAAWIMLAAKYDPDPTQQAHWQSVVEKVHDRDVMCQGADSSWSNSFLFINNGPKLNLTTGSSVVTGTGFDPGMCFGVSSGSVSVENGSARIIGSGLIDGAVITLTGTRQGAPFTVFHQFTKTGDNEGALSALWGGDSGTVSFTIGNDVQLTTIGVDTDDPQLSKNWICTFQSPTELRLDRPWDGASTGEGHSFSYALSGHGQQPFMLGIKIASMRWATLNTDPSISRPYIVLLGQAAQWIHDQGFDATTNGLHYGRIFAACEPLSVANPDAATWSFWRVPNCSHSLAPGAIRASRTYAAEANQALGAYFLASPSQARKDWGDLVYGSIWGYCPYTKPGYYCDPYYVRDENSDASLSGNKWPGFFFGMGMAHQWPAIRQSSEAFRTTPIRRR